MLLKTRLTSWHWQKTVQVTTSTQIYTFFHDAMGKTDTADKSYFYFEGCHYGLCRHGHTAPTPHHHQATSQQAKAAATQHPNAAKCDTTNGHSPKSKVNGATQLSAYT